MASEDSFRRLDALLRVALRLAASAPSGRIALARVAAAIDLDWIPRPAGEALAAQLAAADAQARQPVDFDRVERILHDAWEERVEDVLDALEPEPVAVTAGAQVHRGELDGVPVAVKVLRPDLARGVRQDLVLLESLGGPLAAAFPALDAGAILTEVRERVLEELDLEHEAQVQRRFHRALRRHPHFTVPAPVTRLSHENVAVSEWAQGVPLAEAKDPGAAARRLLVFALGATRFGTAHADLKPDDVRVLEDGRLVILDFGATREVDRNRVELTVAALDAFAAGNAAALGEALATLGVLPAGHGETVLDLTRHALGELAGNDPSRLDGDAVIAIRDRLVERPRPLAELIARGTLAPEDLWPARGVAVALATIARIGATSAWVPLAQAALRDGWDADPDG